MAEGRRVGGLDSRVLGTQERGRGPGTWVVRREEARKPRAVLWERKENGQRKQWFSGKEVLLTGTFSE